METKQNVRELEAKYIDLLANRSELLCEFRRRRADADQRINEIDAEFRAVNAEMITDLTNAETQCGLAEKELRTAAVEHFTATGEKSATANVGVQVRTKLVYDDATALAWAELNNPTIVTRSVNKKEFESLPVVQTLDFVETKQTATATLRGFEGGDVNGR